MQTVVEVTVVANSPCFQQHAFGLVTCHWMCSSGLVAAAACSHHALCMQMCTCYIAEFDRHSHLGTMLPMSSVVLVTTHGVMVAMQCVMVIMHALNMQVL